MDWGHIRSIFRNWYHQKMMFIQILFDSKIQTAVYNFFAQKMMDLWLLLWNCFWGSAHCHFWKFCKINYVLLVNIESYLVFASLSKSLTTRPQLLFRHLFSLIFQRSMHYIILFILFRWVVGIWLVMKLTSDDLLDRLKKKGTREPAFTKALIIKKLNDDDDDVATTSLKVRIIKAMK